jgi:capsular exopolysaccharide synthesis family protein
MGDGKSTLAANLAISVAQTGKRVLLIDADLRRPQLHLLFSVSNNVGVASVLEGTTEVSDATIASAVPGLSIMPSGPLPSNPSELLSSPRMKEMLESLAEKYDLVLLDTPPLLAVTDPSAVAARVDGVILTLRLGKQSRPRAQRAREILATLGAHVLGVVVNAVESRESRYGYGYGYGGYGYGEYGNNRYYHDEHKQDKNQEPNQLPTQNRNGED